MKVRGIIYNSIKGKHHNQWGQILGTLQVSLMVLISIPSVLCISTISTPCDQSCCLISVSAQIHSILLCMEWVFNGNDDNVDEDDSDNDSINRVEVQLYIGVILSRLVNI